ncbi:hypothetical protein LTR84_000734 [Exophiala bonariae]|uniref:Inner centromere protein ARK-binding domain-containing protein n=1 Tax=Exophiala bonariae TaxID=1690606 RepID=A0AAV9NS00_9EURO|nr:hypothetical protein LTR84_000734 [Exophiala bonariae]
MATTNTTVGSASWITAEKENALQLLQNEREEIVFPAQHQLQWLNEHMAEIFSKSNVDMANVFKTPGKVRGKTPRTARKRNVPGVDARIVSLLTTCLQTPLTLEQQPLSDVFSSKPVIRQSPQKVVQHNKPRFEIATDNAEQTQQTYKSQADSGYHTSSQDMDLDQHTNMSPIVQPSETQDLIMSDVMTEQDLPDVHEEHRTTEGSFHSAKEDQTTKLGNCENTKAHLAIISDPIIPSDEPTTTNKPHQTISQELDDDVGSPSDQSSPERPLVRKSSLTFAALPAREPMKSSIGARISRTSHVDQARPLSTNPYAPRSTILTDNQEAHPARPQDEDTTMRDDVDMGDTTDDENVEILGHDDSDEEVQMSKTHSKSSTQRLHEKIDMLGKAPPPRPSKSISSTLANIKNTESTAYTEGHAKHTNQTIDDDDDWIKPLTSPNAVSSPAKGLGSRYEDDTEEEEFDIRAPELIAHEERMRTPVGSPAPVRLMPGYGHAKSASTATLASPAKAAMAPPASPAKSISISNPSYGHTTTPQGSPRRYLDLSASKSRLQSIMKTAKGLFTTSASISAAAKMETLSPQALRTAASNMPGMYPNLNALIQDKPLPTSPKDSRRTRSSSEREKQEQRKEKEAVVKQKMEDQLEKARETERRHAAEQRAAHEKALRAKVPEPPQSSPRRQNEERFDMADAPPPGMKTGRPVRPGRDPPINKAKPAPVSIRVGTLSQRMPMGGPSSSSNVQETLPVEPKRPGLAKKASTASLQSATSTTLKSSVHGQAPKPRALVAAERKKEQDEREAQRKLELKRELERKRAAQQEQARKEEQRQRAEAEKKERERVAAEQAKRQAQQQAIERKRQEAARKAEQQRLDRAANEASAARPASRLAGQTANRAFVNHALPTNPAKPAKRPLEEEAGPSRPQAPKYGDAKRRKTEDESIIEASSRPMVSGAPIRQSQLGKKPSIFNHGAYGPAQQAGHLSQFPQPPSRAAPPQMQQYGAGGKIPFADAPNPPPHTKTPASIVKKKTIQAVRSSPQYPNGDAIHLPEIPTDSEDEDSDDDGNAFPIPDWATPGHLTAQLMRQEGMDGDAVFGPIAPLKMEEIFAKGNKDRLKNLRVRTSSANWAMSGDGLTLEEVRHDREQRERMRVQGGWRFGNGQ